MRRKSGKRGSVTITIWPGFYKRRFHGIGKMILDNGERQRSKTQKGPLLLSLEPKRFFMRVIVIRFHIETDNQENRSNSPIDQKLLKDRCFSNPLFDASFI